MNKIFFLIFLPFIIFSLLILRVFRDILLLENDPILIVKSVSTIPFSENGLSEFGSWRYVTNTKLSEERLEIYMSQHGYKLVEKMWSWYIYINENWDQLLVIWKMYSKYFKVFNFQN